MRHHSYHCKTQYLFFSLSLSPLYLRGPRDGVSAEEAARRACIAFGMHVINVSITFSQVECTSNVLKTLPEAVAAYFRHRCEVPEIVGLEARVLEEKLNVVEAAPSAQQYLIEPDLILLIVNPG